MSAIWSNDARRAANLARLRAAVAWWWLFAALAACGQDPPAAADAGGGGGGGGFQFGDATADAGGGDAASTADAADAADAALEDAPVDADLDAVLDVGGNPDAAVDNGGGSPTIALKITGPDALKVAEAAALTLSGKDAAGGVIDPFDAPDLVWSVDGAPAVLGYDPTTKPDAMAAVMLWKDKTGALRVVGVRPGKATLAVKAGVVQSPPLEVTVSDAGALGIAAAVPDAAGKTDAGQVEDSTGAIRIVGATIGSGGLDASVRFPPDAKSGTALAIAASGQVAASAGFADLAGTKYAVAQGYIFIDQTTLGLFRGTIVGRSAGLKPVVMRFAVPRTGAFGVDALDEAATTLATSDDPEPTTGVHHSRVVALAGAPGKGRFHLLWRRITNGLQVTVVRADVDAATGAVDTTPAPFLDGLNAYDGTPDVPATAFGGAAIAWAGEVGLIVHEGRDGKGASKPHLLHATRVDAELTPSAPTIALGTDACGGGCRAKALPLAGGRFIVVWTAPGGGIRARRVKGVLEAGALAFHEGEPLKIAGTGKDSDAAVHGANVVLTWFDPDTGPVWRRYQDNPSGALATVMPPQPFGVSSPQAPPVSVDALTLAVPTPNLLFLAGWIDLLPAQSARTRRIGLDGTSLAVTQQHADIAWDQLWLRAGQPGQIVLFGRPGDGSIVVRKRSYGSFADPGAPLGDTYTALAANGDGVVHSAAYLAEASTWLVAWGGVQKSKSLHFRRFR